MSAKMFGEEGNALDFACALEMIHTYSLIHDDLPAMDDDSLRRGKPSNHIVYGEGMAILAGDGLLNLAFEIMAQSIADDKGSSNNKAKAMLTIAKAAGTGGMIAGQAADLEWEGKRKNEEILKFIHENKTAEMITASVLSGALINGADEEALAALEQYGSNVGLVFQMVDDILDVSGSLEAVGKTLGKDENAGKQTFVSVYGIEESKRMAEEKTKEAVDALRIFKEKADELTALAYFLLRRDK